MYAQIAKAVLSEKVKRLFFLFMGDRNNFGAYKFIRIYAQSVCMERRVI